MDDAFQKRGMAMEEIFFQQRDKDLLEKMRLELVGKEIRSSLAEFTGIKDPEMIDTIAELGITADTVVALTLIPLVCVAWADGTVQANEREAILKAAAGSNVTVAAPAYALLENWLQNKPGPEVLDGWTHYMQALREQLDETEFNQVRDSILSHAEQVARSAGGFLGLSTISESEQKVLNRLREAFK